MGLKLEDISVAFEDGENKIFALNKVSIAVDPGELAVVTGPSGSGKSTLLAVAGLLTLPDSGEVFINSRPMTKLKKKVLSNIRRDHLAFIFQSANLFPSLTAVEQVEFVAHMRGNLDSKAKKQARKLLDEVGLEGRYGHRPAKLSGGERQRVGIARALMSMPDILLVDEPTASLDQNRGNEIMELLSSTTRSKGIATILVTHDLDRIELADKLFHIVDGNLGLPLR